MEKIDLPDFLPVTLPELGALDIDIADFDFIPAELDAAGESRYIKPRVYRRKITAAKYAKELAEKITVDKGESAYVFLGGRFVFGDFLDCFIRRHEAHVLKMHVATLSMSEDNVVSLANLLRDSYIDSLDLHLSIYAYAHERHTLIPFIHEALDYEDRFQLTISANHAKIVLMETEGGRKITIHGSANLRSSDNIEQIEITEDAELYEFNRDFLDQITKKFKTIKKEVRGGQMPWPTAEDSPTNSAPPEERK